MYLISNKKLPKGRMSFVTTEQRAQSVARRGEKLTGKKPHIYKISPPKRKR